MTRDSLNDEQDPSGPLYARLSAEAPGVGTQRGEGGLSGPQTGAQGVERCRTCGTTQKLHWRGAGSGLPYCTDCEACDCRQNPCVRLGINDPQTARPAPRAVLLGTITTAINQAGFWLAIEGRRAIADAVLAAQEKEIQTWRHTAVRRALKISRLERTIELVEATAQSWQDDPNGHDCAHAVLDALKTYKEQP